MNQKDAYVIDSIETGCNSALLKDLRMKIKMAQNFIKILNYTKHKITYITPEMLGLKKPVFDNLKITANAVRVSTKRIVFRDVYQVKTNSDTIPYMDIREVLIENYIEKRTIPTSPRLRLDFGKKRTYRSNEYMRQCLKERGFVWRKLPETKQSIVVEDPKRVNERHRYFKQIQEYRDLKRPIVYIEERYYLTLKGNIMDLEPVFLNLTKWNITVVTENGLINTHTYVYEPNFNYITWLNDMVIPFLPKNSVIVIEDKLNWEKNELPKVDELSFKKDIKEWLDECGVQYDPEINKAELMVLVNKFTEERSMKLSNFLKGLGHDILRRQKGFPNLSFSTPIGKLIQKANSNDKLRSGMPGKEISDVIKTIIKTVTEEQWREMNECIKKEERKVYEEDVLLDEIVDKIVAMATGTGVLNEELDNFQRDPEYYVFEKADLFKV